jgi:exoribonuclease R
MVIGADGHKRSHTFHRVLMRSAAKLHYAQAQDAADGRTDATTAPLLARVIRPLYAAYAAVKRERTERQPLDLDLPERKILLKPDGTVDRVITPPRLDAHRLIEEFMILANVAAAETLERARVPLIYRGARRAAREDRALRNLPTLDIRCQGQAMRAATSTILAGEGTSTSNWSRSRAAQRRRGRICCRELPALRLICAAMRTSPRRSAATPTRRASGLIRARTSARRLPRAWTPR